MKKIVTIILLLNFSSYAQQWQWAKLLQSVGKIGKPQMVTDNNNNFYLKGTLDTNGLFEGVFLNKGSFVSKFNGSGNIQWAKNIPDVAKMKFNSKGLLCLTGVYSDSLSLNPFTIYSEGGKDIYVAKLNANGQVVALKSFGGPGDDKAFGLDVNTDDDIYITGAYKDSISFGSTMLKDIYGFRTFFLACLDSSLNEKWASTANWTYATGHDVSVNQNKNSYVWGEYQDTCYMCYNGEFMAKFDSNGVITFSQAGSIYGSWHDLEARGSAVHEFGYGCNHQYCSAYIIKYDGQMNQKWMKSYIDTYHSSLIYGAVSPNMEATVAGSYGSWAVQDSVKFDSQWIPLKGKESDIMVARLDSNGNYIWFKTAGGYWYESAEAISLDQFNNCYVYGRISNYQGRADTVVFDTDTLIGNGATYQFFLAKIVQTSAAGIPIVQHEQQVSLFPNPSTGILTIQIKNKVKSIVRIYDTLGNSVFSSIFDASENQIDLSSQSQGIYFLEIIAEGKLYVKKIILK